MTRINAGIEPSELSRAHLLAELREITMVPAALKRSLKTHTISAVQSKIGSNFTLNTGHVSFFYDKQEYLRKRMQALFDEMERRGYMPDKSRIAAFDGIDTMWFGDWTPTLEDRQIVQQRIAERIAQKPHLYKDLKSL